MSEFGRVLKANFSPSPLGVLSVRYFPSCRPHSILVQYWRYVLFARYESASIDVVVCRTLFLFLSASSFFFSFALLFYGITAFPPLSSPLFRSRRAGVATHSSPVVYFSFSLSPFTSPLPPRCNAAPSASLLEFYWIAATAFIKLDVAN